LTRRGAIPRVLAPALAAPVGRCYRHCDQPVRPRRIPSRLPGQWTALACPSGVVSLTRYAEWTARDLVPDVRATLRRWTVPPSLVRRWDLRRATRGGPELGRTAERFLARSDPPRGVQVVYWRVYPFQARDGTPRRLFVCLRPHPAGPAFFAANPETGTPACPRCGPSVARSGRRARARAG